MRYTWLEEAQAGIKIAGRNINNLKYADNTTLMAESEEELKNLLLKVTEESENVGLKLNIQKTKIWSHHFMSNRWGSNGNSERLFLLGGQGAVSKIPADDGCSHEIKRRLLLRRKAMTNLDGILKTRNITLPTNLHLVKAIFQ